MAFVQVLAGVVATAFAGLGYYIGTKDKISEQNVVLAKDGKAMPWQTEGSDEGDLFKYKVCSPIIQDGLLMRQYHPKGNPKNAPRQVCLSKSLSMRLDGN